MPSKLINKYLLYKGFFAIITQKIQTSEQEGMQKTHTIYMTQQEYQKYIKPKAKQLRRIRHMQLRQGVKQMHFCQREQTAVLMATDSILVVDTFVGEITCMIKKLSYPRYVTLAQNGKFILAYYSDNTVSLMDLTGRQVSNILGIPRSSNIFMLSKNSRKLLYGNNQQICLWDVEKAEIEMMTKQWKNINCYALNDEGTQFALGTYSGSIFVLTIIGPQRVTEFQIKRHTKCVMCVAFNKRNIVSVSYDKIYIETTIETNELNEKILTYYEYHLNDVPRSLISCGDRVYLCYLEGLFWLDKGKLVGFSEGVWNVFEAEGEDVIFVKYDKAQIQWWVFE